MRRALAIVRRPTAPSIPTSPQASTTWPSCCSPPTGWARQSRLHRRALAINEKTYGPEHPNVATSLHNLAVLHAELGDWAEAARLHGRAKPIMTAARGPGEGADRSDLSRAALALRNTWALRAAARAVHRARGDSAEAREEGFELAQWALQTGAADALTQMSVRFAKGAGPLAQVVRDRQDLIARRQGEDKRLLAAVGKADAKAADAIRAVIARLDYEARCHRQAAELRVPGVREPRQSQAADHRRCASPAEARRGPRRLSRRAGRFGNLPEETLAWAVTKTEARWISIPLGTVCARRQGCDAALWARPRRPVVLGRAALAGQGRALQGTAAGRPQGTRAAALRSHRRAGTLRSVAQAVRRVDQGQELDHRAVGAADITCRSMCW